MESQNIIIVNWNVGQQLKHFIESIVTVYCESIELGRVWVVDNASTDESVELLDDHSLPLTIIRPATPSQKFIIS